MNKTLLKNYNDFQYLITENTCNLEWYGRTVTMLDFLDDDTKPAKYPCVAVWGIEEDSNGPSYLEVEFVYLDDFNERDV